MHTVVVALTAVAAAAAAAAAVHHTVQMVKNSIYMQRCTGNTQPNWRLAACVRACVRWQQVNAFLRFANQTQFILLLLAQSSDKTSRSTVLFAEFVFSVT